MTANHMPCAGAAGFANKGATEGLSPHLATLRASYTYSEYARQIVVGGARMAELSAIPGARTLTPR